METTVRSRTTSLPFSLAICGIDELPQRLVRFNPSHIISISDPDPCDWPMEFDPAISVLRLAFWDTHSLTGMVGQMLSRQDRADYPNLDHVRAILGFGREIPKGGKLLIHCWAGISRSTASAIMIICQHRSGDEHRAFQLVKTLRPQAQPNRMLLGIADRILGTKMLLCLDGG